ncbi:MAG: tRNA pseudouridine(55) synthase TruB [Candidatus Nomurabacteria bacterium]|nr:MAG: tRNA pseudouridine(55) synthase TruB [Candidatus Nomurabacteria bacterium]
MNWEQEILLIDKPKGITSFDVIRRLRRRYSAEHEGVKAPKMGHAGTLDPLATGLMIIGVGKGTKQLTSLTKLEKEYVAEVRLGERRSTGDLEGEVLEVKDVVEMAEILQSKISAILTDMLGELTLPVSAYSAIKVDGIPMYKRARKAERKGEVVTEVPVRTMRVDEVGLVDVSVGGGRAVATIRFAVGSGTYIRSLAEELGRRLGYPATLQNLHRTRVGEFAVKDAYTLQNK